MLRSGGSAGRGTAERGVATGLCPRRDRAAADTKWNAARMGSIAVAGSVCPTRAAMRPPNAPPRVPQTVSDPRSSFTVRGSNRSLTMDQRPEMRSPPRHPQWR